jgi:hypothetical protein
MICDTTDWNSVNLSYKRYKGVLHLVTAADGAEKYYTLENNQARVEGVELAKVRD